MLYLSCEIGSKGLMVVTAFDNALGADTKESVIWLSIDIP